MAPIEMLSPLMVVVAVISLRNWAPATQGGILAILLLMVVSMQPTDWGRRPATTGAFNSIELHPEIDLNDATLLLIGGPPLGHVVLGLPNSVTVVRIQGNVLGPPLRAHSWDVQISRILAKSTGKLLLMHEASISQQGLSALRRFCLIPENIALARVGGSLIYIDEPHLVISKLTPIGGCIPLSTFQDDGALRDAPAWTEYGAAR